MGEPFNANECRKRVRAALAEGEVIWSRHASVEMRKAGITSAESVQVLRAGIPQPGECENGSWRYRFETRTACVVVRFLAEPNLLIVTAWRIRR